MFRHTFFTWLLANSLHPVIGFIAIFIMDDASRFDQDFFLVYFLSLAYSCFISIPCLLLGWLSLYIILVTPNSDDVRFFLWLITAPALILFEFLVILILFDSIELKVLLYSLPGIAAIVVSILVRNQQFKKLIHTPKIENHETNLV